MSGVVVATVAVVAIASAAVEIGAAVAIGAVTLSAVFATVAAVGAVVATVGALTHDKTLQTVGMVVGAVGGVGALATSAGMFGASPTIEGLFGGAQSAPMGGIDAEIANWSSYASNASGGSVPLDAGSWGPPPAADAATPVAEAQPVTVDAIAQQGKFANEYQQANLVPESVATGAEPTAVVDPMKAGMANPQTPAADATSAAGQTTAGTPAAPTVDPIAPPTTAAPAAPNAPGTMSSLDTSLNNPYTAAGIAKAGSPTQSVTGSTGVGDAFSGIFDFMNNNKAFTMGTMQAASSFFAGAFGGSDGKEPTIEQRNAWQAQADQNTAAANLARWQLSNMQSGIPSASGGGKISVTPGTGMINRPSAVTGVPA